MLELERVLGVFRVGSGVSKDFVGVDVVVSWTAANSVAILEGASMLGSGSSAWGRRLMMRCSER